LKKGLEFKTDFQVWTALTGSDGIHLAKTEKPDVILLDIMMPGMDGTEVAETLLEHPATSSIPIIFVTAIVSENDIKRNAGVAGGRTFIAKPVKIDELIEKINAM